MAHGLLTSPVVVRILALAALALLSYLVYYFVVRVRLRGQGVGERERETDGALGSALDSERRGASGREPGNTIDLTRQDTGELSDILSKRCAVAAAEHGLSPRESELLPLFAMGLSAAAIGRRMFISPKTVNTHRYRMYEKLSVSSHDDLVALLKLLDL